MDDRSTISWMIMGGPRYDEPGQAELDHRRAIREQRIDFERAASADRSGRRPGRLARIVSLLDGWTSRPASALTADYCAVDGCAS